MKKSPISKQKKAAQTMREKYGEDYFSKIGTHSNRVTKGDSERMRELAKLSWVKRRKPKEETNARD